MVSHSFMVSWHVLIFPDYHTMETPTVRNQGLQRDADARPMAVDLLSLLEPIQKQLVTENIDFLDQYAISSYAQIFYRISRCIIYYATIYIVTIHACMHACMHVYCMLQYIIHLRYSFISFFFVESFHRWMLCHLGPFRECVMGLSGNGVYPPKKNKLGYSYDKLW